jgi:carboxylesterase
MTSEPTYPVLPGAEPYSAAGGSLGALVVHGFTGTPHSMRGLAEAFAAAGYTVELPRLPGHGTDVQDMLTTSWEDWSAAVAAAYRDLASRCEAVVVAGLSMGGTLSVWLAPPAARDRRPRPRQPRERERPKRPRCRRRSGALDAGMTLIPGVGGDIADPGDGARLSERRRSSACCRCWRPAAN